MFRSGTTLLARALNAHPSIACASDPMAPLFNSFRHDVASNKYRDSHGRFEPLGDYFEQDSDLLESIWESDFPVPLGVIRRNLLKRFAVEQCLTPGIGAKLA